MIPIELKLHNFMCYRDETLDFAGIHVACLAGDNGHGKSALLDAITWSLWGCSRLGARREDELIHIGEREMEVRFSFEMEGQRYQVIRKLGMAGKSRRSTLQLLGWDAELDRYVLISEGGIRETQERINETLHMDYETFVHSAFLMQGRADAFTASLPSERKEILANILGLGRYERYELRARDLANEWAEEIGRVEAKLEEIERELAQRPHYEAELKQAEEEVRRQTKLLRQAEQDLERLNRECHRLEQLQVEVERLEREVGSVERALQETQQRIEEYRAQIDADEALLARAEEVEARYAALQEARGQDERLRELAEQVQALERERVDLLRRIDAARHEVEKVRESLLGRRGTLEEVLRTEDQIAARLEAIREELASLGDPEEQQGEVRAAIDALREEQATLKAQNDRLREQMNELKDRIDRLKPLESQPGRCPLCDQALSPEHSAHLIETLTAEGRSLAETYRQNEARLRTIHEELTAHQEALRQVEARLKRYHALRRQEAEANEQMQRVVQARAELEQLDDQLRAVEQQLAEEVFAVELVARLGEVDAQIEALGYDRAAHQALREEIERLVSVEEEYQRLGAARARVEAQREALLALTQQVEEREARLEELRKRVKELQRETDQLPELRARRAEAEERLGEARRLSNEASVRLGAAQQKLAYCDRLESEREALREKEQQARAEEALYRELREAFGKRGVQAILIESAIPEIEEEANRLLNRMTDGRMQVRMETQRSTQKGGVVETLDIYVSDEHGDRSYETFSGGERFRIDLALRVALSRLLTRRAGARLQTLIIDEGFGSQDATGRHRIVEAINAIQDEFACVLVITHIEELRNAFPIRIDVVKTPEGSRIYVQR